MKALRIGAAIFVSVLISLYYTLPAQANVSLEEMRHLLQKGLTIYELDRELERLGEMEAEISVRLAMVGNQIDRQEIEAARKKEAAGKVLRSYYMGQRQSLLHALLRMDNFYDMLRAYDLMKRIYKHDKRILESYQRQLNELKELHRELADSRDQLQQIRTAFLAEREKLLRTQAELDAELASMEQDEADSIRRQIEALTRKWQEDGIPLFQQYFSALAESIQHLPEIIADDPGHLKIHGSQIVFQLSDEQLNRFLREKNRLFDQLQFVFADGLITVNGQENDQQVRIAGRYMLRTEPLNHIAFSIEELEYNGLLLPDSTREDLQRQFDLGIYPANFGLEMEATEVLMEDNRLLIQLKMKRNWLDSLFGRQR